MPCQNFAGRRIIPVGDRWNVKQENGGVVSSHNTQSEAEP
jgi:hypothetical protein